MSRLHRKYTEQVWQDATNNVWIWASLDKTYFEVFHRHTGGAFPRLFPREWAPDKAVCSSKRDAAKHAAKMIRAYERARIATYGA